MKLFKKKSVLILFILSVAFIICSIGLFVASMVEGNSLFRDLGGVSLSLSLALTLSFSLTINITKQSIVASESNALQLSDVNVGRDIHVGDKTTIDSENSTRAKIKKQAKYLIDSIKKLGDILNTQYSPLKGPNNYMLKINQEIIQWYRATDVIYDHLSSEVDLPNDEMIKEALLIILDKYKILKIFCLEQFDFAENRNNLIHYPFEVITKIKEKFESEMESAEEIYRDRISNLPI